MTLWLGALRLAFSAVARNKLRAALTVLGILIGVTAVILVTALADGATATIRGQIDSFGSNVLYVDPETVQQSGARGKATGRLTEADGRAIAREAVSIANVAPWLSAVGQIVYGDRNVQTTLGGTTAVYLPVRRYEIAKGAMWTDSDELVKAKVCVLGATVATKLFGTEDAIGRTVRLGGAPFRVVGVLAAKGTTASGWDQDDRVILPIGTFRARVRSTAPGRVDTLLASATSEQTSARAQAQITAILRQRHRIAEGKSPDFRITTQAELREAQEAITSILSALLVAVAAVSLVVGGIGVMNIMLVSVAERTREIGIRLSIGARARDILVQFLIEAIVLSLVGGVLGIVLGAAATALLGRALGFEATPSALAVAVAAATSAFIGIVFGFLPARRAALLDPIEALRQE